MKFLKILTFITLLTLSNSACGPKRSSSEIDFSQFPREGLVQQWQGHTIYLPDSLLITNDQGIASINTARLAKLMNAVVVQITFWEEDNGITLPPTIIGISDFFNLNCCGTTAQGCWRGDNVVIVCTGGNEPGWPLYDDSAWPLYHELYHRYYHLIGHTDSRWPVWNEKMLKIRAWLDGLGEKP